MQLSDRRHIAGVVLLIWALVAGSQLRADVDPAGLLQAAKDDNLAFADKQVLLDKVFENLSDDTAPELRAEAHLLQSQIHMATGDLDAGFATLDAALATTTREAMPSAWIRLVSGRALLQLASGDPAGAVAVHERLLAADNSDILPSELLKVRSNYAVTLHEDGQELKASEAYYEVIPQALELGESRTALILGNNLLVILMTRRLYDDAREWLTRLAPLREESSYTSLVDSLRLHEWELQRIFGDPAGAAAQLKAYLADGGSDNASIHGNAHEYLADALRELGDLEAAETAARQAVDILKVVPFELADARLALARTLEADGRYAAAAAELDRIELARGAPSSRRNDVSVLRHELALREAGLGALATQSRALFDAMREENRQEALQYIRYYDAKLLAQEQQAEIERIRASETRLALEANAAAERALELEQRQTALRDNRKLSIAIVAVSVLALLLTLYYLIRRSYQRKLLAREQEQNRDLAASLEEKTQALSRQLEEQTQMQRALEQKKHSELIGQLTGNVAHDFNNLLQVISNSNEQLYEAGPSAEAQIWLKASNDSIAHAKAITHQLLAYASQQELRAKPIDVFQLLQDNHALFQSAAGESVTIVIEGPQVAANALVDPGQLNTSILNLVRNAADAMPTGGMASIVVSTMTPAQVADWSLAPGDYLVIRVTDDGDGMNAAVLERACEPFFTTKPEGRGTGLGLSTVYGFARQSGGALQVRSTPGVGTSVALALPAVDMPAETVSNTPRLEPRLSLEGRRVLLVEDNQLVAQTISAMLERSGAQVVCRESARSAQLLLEETTQFDVLLSDVRMPGEMDGYELAVWARRAVPAVQLLLMSGYNEPGITLDVPMLRKPFTRQQLLSALACGPNDTRTSAGNAARTSGLTTG